MEPALQRRVQRYGWDKASSYYESYWQQQLQPAQDLLLDMVQLSEGEKVLDIACGTGLVSFRAGMQVGSQGMVIGTDISDNMIAVAKAAALQKNIPQVQFEQMDAEQLKFPDNTFDAVLCALGLMYVPNPITAMKEMYRVLQPGGRVAIAVWGKRDACGWADLFEIIDRRVTSEVCPMFFNLGNPGMLDICLETCGFQSINLQRIQTTLEYDNKEAACGAAFAGGPVALAYFKFTDAIQEEVQQEYLQSIASYQQGDRYQVPGEFVIATAVK